MLYAADCVADALHPAPRRSERGPAQYPDRLQAGERGFEPGPGREPARAFAGS